MGVKEAVADIRNLAGYTDRIKCVAGEIFESYLEIGILLSRVNEGKLFNEEGDKTIVEYAEREFKFKKSSTYNFMKVAQKFAVREEEEYKPLLKEEFKEYNFSQLVEISKIKDEKELEKINPDMSTRYIRAATKEEKKVEPEEKEIEGQIAVDLNEKGETVLLDHGTGEILSRDNTADDIEKDAENIVEVEYTEVDSEESVDKVQEEKEIFQTSGIDEDKKDLTPRVEIQKESQVKELNEIFSDEELNIMILTMDTKRRLVVGNEEKGKYTKIINKLEKHLRRDKKIFSEFKLDIEHLPEIFKKIYEEYIKQDNVSRIVYYPNISLKVEFVGKRFRSFDINGKQGSIKESKIETVPIQEIVYVNKLYYSRELGEKQKNEVEQLKNNRPEGLKQIVHRMGDYIVLIIFDDRVEMISEGGMTINFKDTKVKYEDHEIIWER